MVVWTGWGIVAALIWIASLVITQLAVDEIYQKGFYTANAWPKILASSVSAPFIWFAGRAMNGKPGDERRAHGAQHTMFWILVEHWSVIFIVLGVVFAMVHEHRHP